MMGEMEPEASTPDENTPPSSQWMDETTGNSPKPVSRMISAKTMRRLTFQRIQNKGRKKSAKVSGKRKERQADEGEKNVPLAGYVHY